MIQTKIMEQLSLKTTLPEKEISQKRDLREEARGIIQFCGRLQSQFSDCMSEQEPKSLYVR
jgi:hypothetical protein